MRRLTTFAVGSDVYTLDYMQSMNDNFADTVPRTRRILFADGGFDEFGESPAPAEVGNLQTQIVLYVTDETEMMAKLDSLRALSRGAKGILTMQVEDGSSRWCRARINSISTPVSEDQHSGYIIRSPIALQVNDPHWYKSNTEEPIWGQFAWGEFTYGGAITPQAVAGTQTDFTIAAGGSVRTQPRIVISCGTGETAQNVTIKRMIDGSAVDAFVFTDTLVANDEVEVNCRARSVQKNDVDAYDDFSYSGHPDWFRLFPGNNDIRVEMANGGDEASIYFYFDDVYV